MKWFIINRLFYVIVGAVIGSSLVYLGCGNSDGKMVISAKNIVFRNSKSNIVSQNKINRGKGMSNGGLVPSAFAQEELQDESLKVFAEDVLVDTNDNSLQSENLQDALDNEMAIDIPLALSGKTWAVENKSDLEDLDNSKGQITFTDSSKFTIDSGEIAVPGMWAESADRCDLDNGCLNKWDFSKEATVQFISNNVLYLTWQTYGEHGNSYKKLVQVIPINKSKFIFIGSDRFSDSDGVSTLTLVE